MGIQKIVRFHLVFALSIAAFSGRIVAAQTAAPPAVTVAVPTWETLRAAYSEHTAPGKVETESRADNEFCRDHLAFTDKAGNRVTGLLLRPKSGDGPFPLVLLLHGLGGSKEAALRFAPPLLREGIACVALDAEGHGERKASDAEPPKADGRFLGYVHTTVEDYRQLLSYLAARKDIDAKHISLMGYSMGAMTGAILTGVDERIGAAMLCVGGDPIRALLPSLPEALRPQAATICPSLYVGHISPRPVYFINGKQDTTMPERAVLPYLEAAREPKTVVWVESGHSLPAAPVTQGLKWLSEKTTGKKPDMP